MLKAERQRLILDLLQEQDYMTVNDIATTLNVSSMTIRRDVNELDSNNKLVRLYGGAQKLDKKEKEDSTEEKITKNKFEKEFIGTIMNQLINDGDVVYLGAGTTILFALPKIKKKELFIITNSLLAFNFLISKTDYKVLLTGGDYCKNTEEFVGEVAEKAFDNLNIDIAFAATNGIYNNNITTSNSQEGGLQKKAFSHSKKKIVVADHTKFNVSDVYTYYHVEDLDYIITDNNISSKVFEHYNEIGNILRK